MSTPTNQHHTPHTTHHTPHRTGHTIMTTYLPGTTDPHPTIVVLIDGEPYTYESNMSDAETTVHILTEDMGTDPDTVMIVEDVTPCTITPTSLGGSVICSTCGTYCACTVCSAD